MWEAEWSHPEVYPGRESLSLYVTILLTDLRNDMVNLLYVALQFLLIIWNQMGCAYQTLKIHLRVSWAPQVLPTSPYVIPIREMGTYHTFQNIA